MSLNELDPLLPNCFIFGKLVNFDTRSIACIFLFYLLLVILFKVIFGNVPLDLRINGALFSSIIQVCKEWLRIAEILMLLTWI